MQEGANVDKPLRDAKSCLRALWGSIGRLVGARTHEILAWRRRAPAHALALVGVACWLSACTRSVYRPASPVQVVAPYAKVAVEDIETVRVPYATSYRAHFLVTAYRPVHVMDVLFVSTADAPCRDATPQGDVLLRPGETHRFEKDLSDYHLSAHGGVLDVHLTENDQHWCVRLSLTRADEEPLFLRTPRLRLTFSIGAHILVEPTGGLQFYATVPALGVAQRMGRVQLGLSAAFFMGECDNLTCSSDDAKRLRNIFGGGLNGHAAVSLVPLGPILLEAQARYAAYLVNLPRIGGDEAVLLHGPTIGPQLAIYGDRNWQIGLEPRRWLDIEFPVGLLWSSAGQAKPGVSVGLAFMMHN